MSNRSFICIGSPDGIIIKLESLQQTTFEQPTNSTAPESVEMVKVTEDIEFKGETEAVVVNCDEKMKSENKKTDGEDTKTDNQDAKVLKAGEEIIKDHGVLSSRAKKAVKMDNFGTEMVLLAAKNKWSPNNQEGIVNLATAENLLVHDLLTEKVDEALKLTYDPLLHSYIEFYGSLSVRKTFAQFMERMFCQTNANSETERRSSFLNISSKKVKGIIDPDELILSPGLTSAYDSIACAICNPGDTIMIAAPYYTRFCNDFQERAEVLLHPVNRSPEAYADETGPFQLGVSRLETAYNLGMSKGLIIRALCLVNPCNPLGTLMNQTEMMDVLNWCKTKRLTVIISEIYALSVFDESVKFESILSFKESLPDPQRTVWVWGLSKDLSLPGVRIGVIHTSNTELIGTMRKFAEFSPVPMPVQLIAQNILSDIDWLESTFIPENQKLLKDNYTFAVERLEKMGAKVIPGHAGFFLLADFSKFMKGALTWENETKLYKRMLKANVLVTPGHVIGAETPGYFRVVFSVQRDALQIGLARISKIVKDSCKVS